MFVEDGNKDELEGGLINFEKRFMVAKIIRELQSKCAYDYDYAFTCAGGVVLVLRAIEFFQLLKSHYNAEN